MRYLVQRGQCALQHRISRSAQTLGVLAFIERRRTPFAIKRLQ
jgi:hypothetical protein